MFYNSVLKRFIGFISYWILLLGEHMHVKKNFQQYLIQNWTLNITTLDANLVALLCKPYQ